MASLVGDADGSMRYERILRDAASVLDDVQHDLRRAEGSSVSTSSGIAGLARNLQQRFSRSGRVEWDLRSLATAVGHHAQWVVDTENELRDLERRIRWWAQTHPPSDDPLSSEPDASLIHYWPPHLSLDWRELARRLRAHGAWF